MPMLRLMLALCLAAAPAAAQDRRTPSHCIAIADALPGAAYIHKAAWTDPVPEYAVRISFVSHASFLIQTPGGLNAVTDFTGFIGSADLIPDVVTMNHAHETHWTAFPDPAIPHVLPGWGPYGQGIEHHLDLGEMLIRNVSTDIRSGFSGAEPRGNSIFIFEVAGLCIGHLGHLHHEPTPEQYALIGRLDVVMVPVDGGYTLDTGTMTRIVERLRSSVVIPMHWFSDLALSRFLTNVQDVFAIEHPDSSELTLSLRDLPQRPTVYVLRPRLLRPAE
ncbi:MAG: MBL fold metallo-hydrolase [Roseivivax sp.]|nr:MBL fold metallo-hydrolase [Roseivivax sp.]